MLIISFKKICYTLPVTLLQLFHYLKLLKILSFIKKSKSGIFQKNILKLQYRLYLWKRLKKNMIHLKLAQIFFWNYVIHSNLTLYIFMLTNFQKNVSVWYIIKAILKLLCISSFFFHFHFLFFWIMSTKREIKKAGSGCK